MVDVGSAATWGPHKLAVSAGVAAVTLNRWHRACLDIRCLADSAYRGPTSNVRALWRAFRMGDARVDVPDASRRKLLPAVGTDLRDDAKFVLSKGLDDRGLAFRKVGRTGKCVKRIAMADDHDVAA